MKKIKRSELKRLCFCNSDKLKDMLVVSKGKVHEWMGLGWVRINHPITEDMYEIEED